LPGDICRVAELDQGKNSRFATTAHVSLLKSWWINKEDDLFIEEDMDDQSEPAGGTGIARDEEVTQGRARRTKKPPVWHDDYVC